jgi:hypothetical protein
MTNADALLVVREFFASAGHAGLVLPRGWFGRPHDNLMWLIRADAGDDWLSV